MLPTSDHLRIRVASSRSAAQTFVHEGLTYGIGKDQLFQTSRFCWKADNATRCEQRLPQISLLAKNQPSTGWSSAAWADWPDLALVVQFRVLASGAGSAAFSALVPTDAAKGGAAFVCTGRCMTRSKQRLPRQAASVLICQRPSRESLGLTA